MCASALVAGERRRRRHVELRGSERRVRRRADYSRSRGEAVQVEHIRLTLCVERHLVGCQPVESTFPFKVVVSDCQPAPLQRGGGAAEPGVGRRCKLTVFV